MSRQTATHVTPAASAASTFASEDSIMSVTSTSIPTSTSATTTASSTASTGTIVSDPMIASNFTTFLQLLTTQLQNQDPLSPMDTNQFTQQLVEFAQVEQQMKSNSELTTL